MAWISSTLRRIRSHILTLNGRGLSLRTQSSHGRLVDKRTIIPPNPLANSARSPSSDGVVDSSSNPIANHFRSDGGLVNNKTLISSDLSANYSRSLTDLVENKSTTSSTSSGLFAKYSRSLTDVSDFFDRIKVKLIPNDTFRPVETLQTGSLSQVVENKTISSDPPANSVKSPSSHGVVDSKVISSSDLPANHFISMGATTPSKLCANYLRSLSQVETTISSDPLPKLEFIPDDTVHKASLLDGVGNKSSDPFAKLELIPDDTFRRPLETVKTGFTFHIWGESVGHDIEYAVGSTKTFINHVLFCENRSRAVYKAFDVISNYSIFETCSLDTKLKILSAVFDQIQNDGQANDCEVYLMNTFLRSMSNDDSKKDITKDDVMSRVLHVIQSYPKVGHRKVTEETRFGEDLGFLPVDFTTVRKALYLEFRLHVDTAASCKEVTDYYYDNRMKRSEFEQFRACNISGRLFCPRY